VTHWLCASKTYPQNTELFLRFGLRLAQEFEQTLLLLYPDFELQNSTEIQRSNRTKRFQEKINGYTLTVALICLQIIVKIFRFNPVEEKQNQ
jgi:hypothetical protein